MKKVLWFCSWYPNKLDAFTGDFIQRQAIACSDYAKIDTLYVHKCNSQDTLPHKESKVVNQNLTEHVYYNNVHAYPFLNKFFGLLRYILLHRKFLKQYIKVNGKPDVIHVQIPIKSGIAALFAKWFYRIPFVVTEHYGIYNLFLNDHYFSRSALYKMLTRLVIKNASILTTVSKSLGEDMNHSVIHKPFEVIPNVVDTHLFRYTASKPAKPFRFLHISNMIPLKNVKGIIESVEQLLLKRQDFELIFLGSIVEDYYQIAEEKNLLHDYIHFRGEVPYEQIAMEIRDSHALIIFSDTESQSCVVLESLCVGRPVIVTNIGGVKELVDDHNGYKVNVKDVNDLCIKMNDMIDSYEQFNQLEISENAIAQYAYNEVGRKFAKVYEDVSNHV